MHTSWEKNVNISDYLPTGFLCVQLKLHMTVIIFVNKCIGFKAIDFLITLWKTGWYKNN